MVSTSYLTSCQMTGEKKKVVKYKKNSKYENDCLQNFILLFISLSPVPIVKNSHILARVSLILLQVVLKQI